MKTSIIAVLLAVLLWSSTHAKDMEKTDAKSVATAIAAGNWDIYVIFFYWKGSDKNPALEAGLQSKVADKYKDVFFAKLDCSSSDYHQVLDLFEFQDPRDNFTGRSIHLEELPMVLAIVHGVGYISHGETSFDLIAERMPELLDYQKKKSVQRAY